MTKTALITGASRGIGAATATLCGEHGHAVCIAYRNEADRAKEVVAAIEKAGVAPSALTAELTESALIQNLDTAAGIVDGLSEAGLRVALDDFGTGFCSLAYFRDLPVDEVKIDKSFVSRMLESEKDHAIVKAVIDLAHNFSLKVVAEGVENMRIAERLAEMGCDALQGYVFDRPLLPEEFDREYGVGAPRH